MKNDSSVRRESVSTRDSSQSFKKWSVTYQDFDSESATHKIDYSNDGYLAGYSFGDNSSIQGSTAEGNPNSGSISSPTATNSIAYQIGNPTGQLGVAAFHGLQTFGSILAGEAVLGAVSLGEGISFFGTSVAGNALGGLGVQTSFSSIPIITNSPRFIVSSSGIVFPVPLSAEGPISVINHNGIITGRAFTNGVGGASGDVSTIRIMNPNKRFSTGYIKYENSLQQGVNPYTGKTVSNAASHIPL